MNIISKFLTAIFGEDVACVHGTKGSDGVCMDCCNDLYAPDDEMGEVIDFPPVRDTI